MPDYSHAVIYRIINKETGENLYVGSTCSYNKRMFKHKYDCSTPSSKAYNSPIYIHIREIGGWSAVRHVMIEQYTDCQDKLQLIKREQEYIDQYTGTKNAVRSYTTIEQKKDQQKEVNKKYYIEHADKIKQYYNENSDKIKEQRRQYRIEHADKIKDQRRQAYLKKKQLQDQS